MADTSRFYPGTLANQTSIISKVDAIKTQVDALARQEMTLGSCHYANMKYTAGTGVALRWKDPNDTVVHGYTWATWARTVIVRKDGSDPTSPTDGTVVVTTTTRDQYLSTAYVDANGTSTSHYRAFPYSTAEAYNQSADNIFKSYTLFSYTIDESNSDEATCIEYGDACTDFSPIAMNFTTGVVSMGSWANAFFMPKPCMLHRADADHATAYVDYYLDQSDYTKKSADDATDPGGDSKVTDTTYNGNAMMEFPAIYMKVGRDYGKIKVYISSTKIDADYECWNCKKSDGTYAEHFYLPIYEGSETSGVLRSMSTNATPKNSTSASTEWSYATSNNVGTEKGWGTTLWADEQLMRALGYLVFKRLNSQLALGGSYTTRSSLVMKCGEGNTLGLFYGKDEANTSTYTPTKFFGMENWWGHRWRRAQGIVAIDYLIKTKMTLSEIDGSTGTSMVTSDSSGDYNGYVETGAVISSMSSTYTTRMMMDGRAAFVNGGGSGGSSTTFYCDGAWSSSGTRGLLCGGFVAAGPLSGVSALVAVDSPSFSGWNSGASLSYHYF